LLTVGAAGDQNPALGAAAFGAPSKSQIDRFVLGIPPSPTYFSWQNSPYHPCVVAFVDFLDPTKVRDYFASPERAKYVSRNVASRIWTSSRGSLFRPFRARRKGGLDTQGAALGY
jgi:hypothetical protein